MSAPTFLTGASGFIGGALAERLVADGHAVRGLARSDAAAAAVRARGAEAVRGTVLDEDVLAEGMAGCEVAFHVAALNSHCPQDPRALMRTNVAGTEAAVRAAARAGVRRLVLTSSAAAVGEAAGTVGTEASPHRGSYLSAYDRSKHESEARAFALGAEHGLEVVALGPSSVQGPGRSTGNGKIVLDYLNGKLPVFVDTHVSVCDVADCVEAHVLAAGRGTPGERYLLNGATLTSDAALGLVRELSGVEDEPRILPHWVARTAVTAVEGAYRLRGRVPSLCRDRVATILHGHRYDGSRAERELGLRYTPVRETFRRTIAWALEAGLVQRDLPAWRG